MSAVAKAEKNPVPVEPELAKPKSNATAFLQHAVIYGLGTISIQLVSIVLMPLYTNNLTTSEYGVLTTLYRIGDVLNICLMMNGIRQASLNFWCNADDKKSQAKIPPTVTLFTFCILIAGTLFAFGSSEFLANKFDLGDPLLLACGTTAMLLQAFTVMPLALMQARLESKWYVVTTLAILGCQLSLVIFGVLGLGWGVWGVVVALMITYGVFGIALTARELWGSSIKPDIGEFWKIVKFSAPFIPSGLCFFVLHNGDHFFLLKYYGTGLAGVYGLGYRLAKGAVMMSFQPFLQVWGAWMYKMAKKPGHEVTFGQMYTRIIAACTFVGLTLLIFQDEVLELLSSAEFAGAERAIPILVFAHFLLAFCYLLDSAFYVNRRTDLKPWLAAATTIVMLIAYAIMIPKYGDLGAAWATFIGFAFYACLNMLVAYRVIPVVYELGRMAKVMAIAAAIYFCSRQFGLGTLEFFINVGLWATFPIAVWFLVTDQEEKQFARQSFGKGVDMLRDWRQG